eukprot:4070890-Amphidinium_carterae.1
MASVVGRRWFISHNPLHHTSHQPLLLQMPVCSSRSRYSCSSHRNMIHQLDKSPLWAARSHAIVNPCPATLEHPKTKWGIAASCGYSHCCYSGAQTREIPLHRDLYNHGNELNIVLIVGTHVGVKQQMYDKKDSCWII